MEKINLPPLVGAYGFIPEGAKDPNIESILAAFDASLAHTRQQLEDSQDFLDPDTCPEQYLDWLASLSVWRGIWQTDWSAGVKRQLLKRQVELWENRYSADTLHKVFNIFGLEARLEPLSGLILGNVPANPAIGRLTASTVLYRAGGLKLKISPKYVKGGREFQLILYLKDLFGPGFFITAIVQEN